MALSIRQLTRCTGQWTQTLTKQLHRQRMGLQTSFSTSAVRHGESYRKEPAEMPGLMDIGSRRIFNSEHDLFRENVRRYFREQVAPEAERYEKDGNIGREAWKRAGDNGLLGVSIPAEIGGIGGTYLHAAITMEEQIYIADFASGFTMHSDIVMPYICTYGTQEQIKKYIPPMTAGERVGALAMTEPGAGSDLQGIRTTCVRDGDDWVLNGSKTFITNGYLSDVVIVVAKTNPSAKSPAQGISLFLVDGGLPGFTRGTPLRKLGLTGQDTCELFFDDVRLPGDALLGKENHGFYYLMQQLPAERLVIASVSTASCEWMFETARDYVRQRKAFGKTIADLQIGYQVTQHKLAEMKTSICCTRAFTDQCLEIHDQRGLDPYTASMVKYWSSDLLQKIGYDATQLHGGSGFMWEQPITKAFAAGRVQSIYAGTNEIMKELIARPIVQG